MMRPSPFRLFSGVCLLIASTRLGAQATPVRAVFTPPSDMPPLTLDAAVRTALANHPRIAAARATAQSAASDLSLARAAQLPTVEAQWQTLRSTGSAVAGTHFGMNGVPGVGGPPGNRSPAGGVWGATAAVVTSMPITGLLRAHRVVEARTARSDAASARLEQQQLDVAARAAASYLEARAGLAQRRAALASRQRAMAIDSLTRALALQGLRPGADSMRSAAEVAAADIEVARAERAVAVAQARLAESIGVAGAVRVDTGALSVPSANDAVSTVHPAEREATALVQEATAEQRVAATAWLPRFDILGAAFARGSGEPVAGIPSAVPMRGIAPNVGNWAIGVVASWPLTGVPALRAQQRRAAADADAARARALSVHNDIEAGRAEASAALRGAHRIAERTATLVAAANATLEQFVARYRAGLTSLVDVADAQRQLARAEVDDAVARIEVVAARLQQAQARGDVAGFLSVAGVERAR